MTWILSSFAGGESATLKISRLTFLTPVAFLMASTTYSRSLERFTRESSPMVWERSLRRYSLSVTLLKRSILMRSWSFSFSVGNQYTRAITKVASRTLALAP